MKLEIFLAGLLLVGTASPAGDGYTVGGMWSRWAVPAATLGLWPFGKWAFKGRMRSTTCDAVVKAYDVPDYEGRIPPFSPVHALETFMPAAWRWLGIKAAGIPLHLRCIAGAGIALVSFLETERIMNGFYKGMRENIHEREVQQACGGLGVGVKASNALAQVICASSDHPDRLVFRHASIFCDWRRSWLLNGVADFVSSLAGMPWLIGGAGGVVGSIQLIRQPLVWNTAMEAKNLVVEATKIAGVTTAFSVGGTFLAGHYEKEIFSGAQKLSWPLHERFGREELLPKLKLLFAALRVEHPYFKSVLPESPDHEIDMISDTNQMHAVAQQIAPQLLGKVPIQFKDHLGNSAIEIENHLGGKTVDSSDSRIYWSFNEDAMGQLSIQNRGKSAGGETSYTFLPGRTTEPPLYDKIKGYQNKMLKFS